MPDYLQFAVIFCYNINNLAAKSGGGAFIREYKFIARSQKKLKEKRKSVLRADQPAK